MLASSTSGTSGTVDKPDISVPELVPADPTSWMLELPFNFWAHHSKAQLYQLFSNSSINHAPGSPTFLSIDLLSPKPPHDSVLIIFTFADKPAPPHSSLEGCLRHPLPPCHSNRLYALRSRSATTATATIENTHYVFKSAAATTATSAAFTHRLIARPPQCSLRCPHCLPNILQVQATHCSHLPPPNA